MHLNKKNIVLLFGLILLLWISYIFSFSKSFEIRNKYRTLSKEKEILKSIPNQIIKLKKENIYLDSLLAKNKLSSESSFQNNLLQHISSYAKENNLKIVSFNSPHIFYRNEGRMKTFSFSIKGNYTTITKLIYNLEQKNKFGKIISIDFERKKNYRLNRNYLVCEILLQRIER